MIIEKMNPISIGDERYSQDGNPTAQATANGAYFQPQTKSRKDPDSQQPAVASTEVDSNSVLSSLTILLADTYVLYVKTQLCHWNVTGVNFLTLHTLFMNQYIDLADAVDLLAERMRALGRLVPGNFLALSGLGQVNGEPDLKLPEQMLKALIADQESVIQSLQKYMPIAEQAHDYTTVDLMTRRLQMHEKNLWMLRSSLK